MPPNAGIIPTAFDEDEWKYKYQRVLEVFKEFNETFPSGFVDKNKKSGIRCFDGGTSKMKKVDFWMGITRNPENGVWTSLYAPSTNLSNLNLKANVETDNCVINNDGEPDVASCSYKFPCAICRVSQSHLLFLKGLCKNDLAFYDEEFYIYGLKNNRPYFK